MRNVKYKGESYRREPRRNCKRNPDRANSGESVSGRRSRPWDPWANLFLLLQTGWDGSRDTPPRGIPGDSSFEDEREVERERLERIRDKMLLALNGDEDALEIALRVAADESLASIGQDFGISRWTVRRRYVSAVARLKTFGSEFFDDDCDSGSVGTPPKGPDHSGDGCGSACMRQGVPVESNPAAVRRTQCIVSSSACL